MNRQLLLVVILMGLVGAVYAHGPTLPPCPDPDDRACACGGTCW